MSMTGRVNNIRIRDDNNPENICTYTKAKLELTKTSIPKVSIKLSPDDRVAYEFELNNCSYMEESSVRNSVECIRINSEQQTLILIGPDDNCIKLVDYIQEYLTNKSQRNRSPSPKRQAIQVHKPVQTKKINELIEALNESDAVKAANVARELAENKESIRFALDMINESGNAQSRLPPPPVVEILKLKMLVETFLIENNNNETYDVAIVKGTSIKELKQLIQQNGNINTAQQFWYINRELLDDDYKFGVTKTPRVNETTVLILYIAKPSHN